MDQVLFVQVRQSSDHLRHDRADLILGKTLTHLVHHRSERSSVAELHHDLGAKHKQRCRYLRHTRDE